MILRPQNISARSRRHGSVLALTVLSTVVMLSAMALVADYATVSLDASRLQRGCDAAALAAASQLKQTSLDATDAINAYNMAMNVASKNKVNLSNITFSDNNTKVRVTASTQRGYFFAPVMGIKSGTVIRSASAGVAAANSLTTAPGGVRVAPIGITWDTYNAYKDDRLLYHDIKLIRQNKMTFGLNDAVLFDLRDNNAKSPAQMQDQLTGEDVETSTIGDFETTLNANNNATSKKLEDGLQTLFDQSKNAPWNDTNNDGSRYNDILTSVGLRTNPRVVYLIVTPSTSSPKNGTFDTEVQGFAPVYIESYYDQGADETYMRIRFLPPADVSDGSVPPSTDPNNSMSGVRITSLLD